MEQRLSETAKHIQSKLKLAALCEWLPEEPTKVIIAIHGLGGRGEWFARMADILTKSCIAVYSYDLRGFGINNSEYNPDSPYARGHVKSWINWIDDSQSLYQEIKNLYPNSTITLMGHSMGALIVSNLYEIFPGDKMILSVPGFKGAASTFSLGFNAEVGIKLLLSKLLNKDIYLSLPISEKKEPDPSDADPLKVREVTANLLWQILMLTKRTKEAVRNIKAPLLMIQAQEDIVVDNETMKEYFELIPSPDKTFRTFSGALHDWIWYDSVEPISEASVEWLTRI